MIPETELRIAEHLAEYKALEAGFVAAEALAAEQAAEAAEQAAEAMEVGSQAAMDENPA